MIDLRNIEKYVHPQFIFLFREWTKSMVICTGGRASSKTTSIIQYCIVDTFKDDNNIVVVRGTYSSHRDTTYQEFIDWIGTFGLENIFDFRVSPLMITNKITGAKIYFKGCDDVGKIKGIKKVKTVFFDEANVGITERDFHTIKFSMRSKKIKYIMAYNPTNPFLCPWKKYIDNPEKYNVFHFHSTYLDNPFLSEQYIKEFDLLKQTNPRVYKTDGLGEYGVYEDAILDEKKISHITLAQFNNLKLNTLYEALGIDFGESHDTTFSYIKYDEEHNDLYIMHSIGRGGNNMTTMKFIKRDMVPYEKLKSVHYKFADSEDLGGRIELNEMGWKFKKAYKINMELTFIEFFNNLNHCYIVGNNAKGFESNAASWVWKNGRPDNKNDDYVDSVRYALEVILKTKLNKVNFKMVNHDLIY